MGYCCEILASGKARGGENIEIFQRRERSRRAKDPAGTFQYRFGRALGSLSDKKCGATQMKHSKLNLTETGI